MSKENPTPEEVSSIEQHQSGSYGVELPDWYVNEMGRKETDATKVITQEAISAAAQAIRKADNAMFDDGDEDFKPTLTDIGAAELAQVALEAAAPFMFKQMEEQQAKLDAVKTQLEVWEAQAMGGNDVISITARFAFETVCKRLRTALGMS